LKKELETNKEEASCEKFKLEEQYIELTKKDDEIR